MPLRKRKKGRPRPESYSDRNEKEEKQMKLHASNLGECGAVQMFCAGTVNYDNKGLKDGVLLAEVPAGLIVLRAVVDVKTAFAGGEGQKLSIGLAESKDEIVKDADISKAGAASTETFVNLGTATEIYAKCGEESLSAGRADVYLVVVPAPVE